jgi:environmental stress-induced protein Ves
MEYGSVRLIRVHSITLFSPDTYRSMPWRNGLGTTVELLKQERAGGDGFAWRLSMADVTADGEFSNFVGYDRILLLLEGNGLVLDCAGVQHRLEQPLQAARFRGDDATVATLLDGPVKDFNIMVCRDLCSARVIGAPTDSAYQAEASNFAVDADLLLVYAVDGELSISGTNIDDLKVRPGHLCVVREPASGLLHCHGAGYIATQITHHRDAGLGA